MFNRNRYSLSFATLIIGISFIGAVSFFAFLCLLYKIVKQIRKKDYYYTGESINGKASGKGTIYYTRKDFPIKRIYSDNWSKGKIEGLATLVLKEKNNKERPIAVSIKNGYVQKMIFDKKQMANFVINEDPDYAGNIMTDYGYQKKYGLFQQLSTGNVSENASKFFKQVGKKDDIKVVKLTLLNHGTINSGIIGNSSNVAKVLDEACKVCKEKNKKLYVVNYACYSANKFENAPEQEQLDDLVAKASREYNIDICLAKHNNENLEHVILTTYDKKSKHKGVMHIGFNYRLVKNGAIDKRLSKAQKNEILYNS